jgi:two-component system, sensor histidine kinase
MPAILDKIDRLFDADVIARDETGHLQELAAVLDACRPKLLFLASADGAIKAADNFGSETDLMLARRLAREAAARGDGPDPCLWTAATREKCQAFALRLQDGSDSEFLGGLLPADPANSAALTAAAPALRTCGRVAWRAIERDEAAARVRTRVEHLLAEHDTLKAAHTEAVVQAIEEHDHCRREEQERLAIEQVCAATESANRAKSQFLANMSHEIRTPLSAILGFTDLLRNGADEDDEAVRKDYLETIYESANHLLELINDILDLSKIEAGRMEIERTACSPHEIIASLLSLLRVRAREKGLELKCEWPDGVPTAIFTDALRLRQMLMNLVGNALKFTSRGRVTIICRLIRGPKTNQMAFEVHDTGIGIAADKLESIFDAFVQADSSVTREFGGTGLGLAISRKIARALGGDVKVQSTLRQGSVFTATIDVGSLDGISMLPSPPSDALAAEARPMAVPLGVAVRHVLLVEDGETNRKLITLMLRRSGVEVTTAENGRLGMNLALRTDFDVILMDMQMPVMDGYTATQQLRALGVHTPIIALTAHAMAGDEQKCIAAGCSAYLSKPIKWERLLQALTDVKSSADAPLREPGQATPREASRPAAVGGSGPILSTLPLDDPDFREIAEEFIVLLREQLQNARQAFASNDISELARLGHTLKGTAGGAGFDVLGTPAAQLEQLAKGNRVEEISSCLEVLEELAGRIVLDSPSITSQEGQ